MTTPRILPGSICHLNAARAKLGTAPGNNSDPTSQFYDLSGNANHGTLTNFAFETGNRPRTNSETDKAVWHDLSGNGNDGTLVGWTYLDGDRWDGAGSEADPYCLECAGVNTQRVTCAAGGPTGDFSIDTWAWVANVADNHGLLIGRDYNGAAGWGYYLNQGYATAFLTTTTLSDRIQVTVAGSSVFANAWHYFGASFDRDGYLRVYYDGAYVTQVDISSKAALDLSAKHPWLFNYSAAWTFQGKLAAAREYNTVLSDADFAQNYATGKHGTDYVRSGLVLDLNAARAVRPSGWVSL